MSISSALRSKREEIVQSAIPILIACFPLIWLAPIHRHFHHAVADWDNTLWMIGYNGEYFRRHLSFPLTFNTDQLVGMPNPLFYGSLFFPLAGLLSAFFGSALTLRMVVVALFWLQTTQIIRTVKAVYQDSYAAWAIAAVVAFAIYPLTNLYSRSALSEFVAVSLLTSACCLWLRAMIEGPRQRTWSSASWACLLLALSAGTHSITALFGGLFFGILVMAGISGSSDGVRRTKFMVRYTALYWMTLSPWLYVVVHYFSRLSIARVSTEGTLFFRKSIDLWWSRLLPVPFDIRTLSGGFLSEVSTPYLDAQINFGLLLIAGYLVFQVGRRFRAGRLDRGRVIPAAALCLGAFFATFYLSVSSQAWWFVPRSLHVVQFFYRLVSYCDLLLFILVLLLLSALNKFRAELESTFRICLTAAVVLMTQAVLVKFNHAAYIQEDKIVAGTVLFGDRTALKILPASFYNPRDYVVQNGYAGVAPALPLLSFLPATGARFGEVPSISLNGLKNFETNILAFPWNRLVINGKLLPSAETYISANNTLAYGDFGRGAADVGYLFVPDRKYLILRSVSTVVLFIWIGVLVSTALWRRRTMIFSSKTIFSGLIFLLIAVIGNALPRIAAPRSLVSITPGVLLPEDLSVGARDLPASPPGRVPAVVIKMQVQFIHSGHDNLGAQAAGQPMAEPLVVTGVPGAADMLGILYAEDGSLRFQIDHWGAPLVTSNPIKIMPGQICWVQEILGPRGVSVGVDGEEIMRSEVPAYPTTRQQITIAHNNLGGTTTAAQFSGKVIKSLINLK